MFLGHIIYKPIIKIFITYIAIKMILITKIFIHIKFQIFPAFLLRTALNEIALRSHVG